PDRYQGGHASLGGGVIALAHVAGAGDRRDVDDCALIAVFDHAGGGFTATQEHAGEVDVDDGLPLGQLHALFQFAVFEFDHQAVTQDAGIVHQAVQVTEVVDDGLEGGFNIVFFSDVAHVGFGIAAGFFAGFCGFGQFVFHQINEGDLGTFGCQIFCNGTAQSLVAAGDCNNVILKFHGLP